MTIAMTAAPPVLTLDELSALRCRDLRALFQEGLVPERFSALNGRPKGRLLAFEYLDRGPLFSITKTVANLRGFPWDGKSFASTGKRCGIGHNRINLLVREAEWFHFKTRVDKSGLDGKSCIRVDYGVPENPWPVNRLRDELREVSPGLYLGVMLWQAGYRAHPLLWFAIDARLQC